MAWATPAALHRVCSSEPREVSGLSLGPIRDLGRQRLLAKPRGRGGEAAATALMGKAFAWLFQGATPSPGAAIPAPRALLLPGPQRGLGRVRCSSSTQRPQLLAWPSSPEAAGNHVQCVREPGPAVQPGRGGGSPVRGCRCISPPPRPVTFGEGEKQPEKRLPTCSVCLAPVLGVGCLCE